MHLFSRVVGALVLSAAFSVSAQNNTSGPAALGPVTVTATRTPLIANQEVAPVVVITAEQIALSGAQSIGTLLQQYAGFDIARNGGPGQPTSLFLRGANSNQTLVMINGVKINPQDGAGAPLENIHLIDIERIEIVKGPRAALYGSAAIGGVINIITRQPGAGTEVGAHLGAGRYGTYDSGGSFGYGQGASGFGISADNYHTAGFPAVAGTPWDSGNTDRNWNAFGRTRIGGIDVSANHWQSEGNTQYTEFASTPPFALAPVSEDYADRVTGLNATGEVFAGWRSTLSLSHRLYAINQRQADAFNPNEAPDFVSTQSNVVDWQNDLAAGPNQLFTAGLYSEAEHGSALSFGSGFDEPDRISALYAEDDIHAGSHRLVLAARDTHDQAFGDHLTWNADYGYDFTATTRLTAGVGTGFRAPSPTERFGFGGNPALRPEASQNVELGLRQQISVDQSLTLSAFRDNLNNLIEFVVTPSNLNGENQNVDRARVRGLEADYRITHRHWTWRLGAIFQKPEDLNLGSLLLRRAERTVTTAFGWHNDRTSLGVQLRATGARSDLDFNTGAPVSDAGYVLAGLTLGQKLSGGLSIRGSFENLLDTHYQTANGYNMAGRSLFVQLNYAFSQSR